MEPLLLPQGSLLLSIPAVCNIAFLFLAPLSLAKLYRAPVKVGPSWQSSGKTVQEFFPMILPQGEKILIP